MLERTPPPIKYRQSCIPLAKGDQSRRVPLTLCTLVITEQALPMVSVFRFAILAAVVCAAVALFLPGVPMKIEVMLPVADAPVTANDLAILFGLAATLGTYAAMVLTAIAAAGLLRFKAWARPMALWGTIPLVCFLVVAAMWSPIPTAGFLTATHITLFVVAASAWTLALLLLRSAPVRARFVRR